MASYGGPITLAVSQESRVETLKSYTQLFGDHEGISPLYFCKDKDVLSFRPGGRSLADKMSLSSILRVGWKQLDMRHIKSISMSRMDSETKWILEEILYVYPWVEEINITGSRDKRSTMLAAQVKEVIEDMGQLELLPNNSQVTNC